MTALVSLSISLTLSPPFPACGQAATASERPTAALDPLARLEREKVAVTDPGKLMDALGVGPGTVILDIGAGTGQWSYAFARRLEGSGRVYATEIDPLKISFIEEEIGKRGLSVIQPVLVSPDGVDPFYTRQNYDIIFLSHVYYYLKETSGYFSTLGNQLKENGRLVVIVLKHQPFFSLEDFVDIEGLRVKLTEEPGNGPFYGHLRDSTWSLIQSPPPDGYGEALKAALAVDFNAMLDLPHFYEDFDADLLSFTAEEKQHFSWLLGFVSENISYDGRQMPFRDEEENRVTQYGRLIRFLNRLVIYQNYREHFREGSLRASKQDMMIAGKLAGEGFVLEESLDLHPFNFTLVFRKEE